MVPFTSLHMFSKGVHVRSEKIHDYFVLRVTHRTVRSLAQSASVAKLVARIEHRASNDTLPQRNVTGAHET
jgi:hypothetical protein